MPPSGGGMGGSEQAAQHQRRSKGDRTFSATQQLEEPQAPPAVEKQVVSTPTTKGRETSGEGEGWKPVTSDIKRKGLAPQGLQLLNRFISLKAEKEPDVPTTKVSGPPNT